MISSLIGVTVLLGGLVFFHELGHYSIAKLFGVRVEVFSLGFGKKLFSKRIGETEYCLSLFPLGGYVKLMGDDPYKAVPASEAHRAFSTQKLYKRFAIVAAGPLSNLLLAYFLFTIVFWVGQPVGSTQLGTVVIGSPAWTAGLRAKDRVQEIGGTKVENWNDLEEQLKAREGQTVDLVVDRANEKLRIPVAITKVKGKNEYGEDVLVGGIKGISSLPLEPMIGISNPNTPAYIAGLRTGDTITKINTRQIQLYEDISEALAEVWKDGSPVTISVTRGALDGKGKPTEHSFSVVLPKKPAVTPPLGLAQALQLYPSELFVLKLSPDSPAEKGGLLPGDRIVKVAGQPIYNFESVGDEVQAAGAKDATIPFVVERAGSPVTLSLKPTMITQEDPLTHEEIKRFMVGYSPQAVYHEPETVTYSIRDPLKLIPHAVSYTNTLAKRMVVGLVKLASGKMSMKNLGGPVLIASVAGKSLDAGIIPFLYMMALISINLFLLNLFPVPVLDGGHLLFFTIEAIKGKPVSIKTMEIANQIGMVFILVLIALTFFNDISRLIPH